MLTSESVPHPSSHLAEIFGDVASGIGPLIERLKSEIDTSQSNIADNQERGRFNFAPSYRGLDANALRELDDSAKATIFFVLLEIEAIPREERNYERITGVLKDCHGLGEPIRSAGPVWGDHRFYIPQRKLEADQCSSAPTAPNSSEADRENEKVKEWFADLVKDTAIAEEIQGDLSIMQHIERVTRTATTQSTKVSAFYTCVLRFPTKKHPNFEASAFRLLRLMLRPLALRPAKLYSIDTSASVVHLYDTHLTEVEHIEVAGSFQTIVYPLTTTFMSELKSRCNEGLWAKMICSVEGLFDPRIRRQVEPDSYSDV